MSESGVMHSIMLALSASGATIFRNNVGAVKASDGRFIRFGLCPGSSDLIGFMPVTVTPDMVGKQIALFLAVEAKAPGGHTDLERKAAQDRFINAVLAAGGLAGYARTVEQALGVIGHGGDHCTSREGGARRTSPGGKPKHGVGTNDPGD